MVKSLLFIGLLFPTFALGQNLRCNKQVEGSRLNAFFCPCKSRLDVKLRVDPGTFAEGEKVPVTIDGVRVGAMTMNTSGAKLAGQLKKNKNLAAIPEKGSLVTVGDLTCKMR